MILSLWIVAVLAFCFSALALLLAWDAWRRSRRIAADLIKLGEWLKEETARMQEAIRRTAEEIKGSRR